jgi:ABC-type antimicrobial peptide transport system ATPase subunit
MVNVVKNQSSRCFHISLRWYIVRGSLLSPLNHMNECVQLKITHQFRQRTPGGDLVNVVSCGQSSNDMPTKTSQCCRHLWETAERVGSFRAHSQPYKETMENSTSKILLISCLKFHLGFACSISSVVLTDNIFAVLETSVFSFQSCQLYA